MKLTNSQKKALKFVSNYANRYKIASQNEINEILKMSNNSKSDFLTAVENIRNNARVGIHFHPDRPDHLQKTTVDNLHEQGIYKNQFETNISSGGLSAFRGGDRDKWENIIFGKSYSKFYVKNSERPKYGALNLLLNPDGPSPRFGSCYFLLKPEITKRCTFTYMDSHRLPKERGTLDEFDLIISGLLRDTFHYNNTLGERDITIRNLLQYLKNDLTKSIKEFSNIYAKRHLNHYIEAQIHGNISLKDDVEILVADPAFIKTDTGEKIINTCNKYSIELLWHMGFAMDVNDVPDNFRGNDMPELAKTISTNNIIDTHHLGLAVIDINTNPEKWNKWGSKNDSIQKIKLLWHILVKYGKRYNEIYK